MDQLPGRRARLPSDSDSVGVGSEGNATGGRRVPSGSIITGSRGDSSTDDIRTAHTSPAASIIASPTRIPQHLDNTEEESYNNKSKVLDLHC